MNISLLMSFEILQTLFKSNLNLISRERYKSEDQRSTLQNVKLLYESQKDIMKLSNIHSSIASEAKYKAPHGQGRPGILACVGKVSDRLLFKILTSKQMLQRLPIARAQVKARNTFENLLSEICRIIDSLY